MSARAYLRPAVLGLVFGVLMLLGSTANGAERISIDFTGFSRDGQYLAFEQYGMRDGLPWAQMSFIDVLKNRYAAWPIEVRHEGSAPGSIEMVRVQLLKEAKNTLGQLKIVPENRGVRVVNRLSTDVGVDPHQVRFTSPTNDDAVYTLRLEEREGRGGECPSKAQPAKIFTMNIVKPEEQEPHTLQRDVRVPGNRLCPQGYRIRDVHLYQDQYLVVFIAVTEPTEEGSYTRYIAVSGRLK